jgi:hypothetical protein
MIIINATLEGENTYEITISENSTYQVSAFDLESAIDLVADYIESHHETELFIEGEEFNIIAGCSRYKTVEAYAEAHKFTKCGKNGIYLEITNVKGCPNG